MSEGKGLFHGEWLDGEFRPRIHAYYFKEWQSYSMAYHTHDSTEVMYVISGSCQIQLMDYESRETSLTLRKGDFILLNATLPHRLLVEPSCRMLNVEFEPVNRIGSALSLRQLALAEVPLAELIRESQPYLVLRDPDEVYHALKGLVLELNDKGTDQGLLAQLLLAELLIRIGRLHADNRSSSVPQSERYVKQAMSFMQQNYDRDIRLKDIASAVNVHPSYLQRIFKMHSGQSVIDYLTAHRVEKAKMLLRRTDIPIADISDYVGVSSRQYFHALFKKHTSQTPVAYRSSLNTHRMRGD